MAGSYLEGLPRAWYWRGDECHCPVRPMRTSEVVQSVTSKRPLAVYLGGYKRLSGALLSPGEVGLIQPEDDKPVLVRREVSTNGKEYLAEL